MSQWTQIVGAMRIDGIPDIGYKIYTVESLEKILGPMCLFDDLINDRNKESTLPRGSEGSIMYKIIEYYTGLPWVVVPIWGSLRDYDNSEEIVNWFKNIIKTLNTDYSIRDAIIRIYVEGKNVVVFQYDGEIGCETIT